MPSPLKRLPSYRLAFLLLSTLGLVRCQQNAPARKPTAPADTIEVTSYSIERENNAALADWKGFQVENEFIALPPDWQSTVKGYTLVCTPGKNQGGQEVLTFARFDREGDSREISERLGQQAAQNAFSPFTVQGDTLKALVFQQGFGYERNADLATAGVDYKGYCLLYADDSTFYKYTLILSKQRLNAYHGNLISDIVSNLKIDKQYVFRTENPLQTIKILKP
jgi:hypothetical protein